MQNRFKYRAQTKNRQWVYGSLVWILNDSPQIWDEEGKDFIVKPKTIGQCTGIEDQNCDLIYEGDIIELWGCDGETVIKNVYFDSNDATFRVDIVDSLRAKYECNDYKIIGNIYDNPELLETYNPKSE